MPHAHWWIFSPNEWLVTLVTGNGVWSIHSNHHTIHFNPHWWHSVPVMRSSSAAYEPCSPLDDSVPVISSSCTVGSTLVLTGWHSVPVISSSHAAICTLFPIGWHSVPVTSSVYTAIYNFFSIGWCSVPVLRSISAAISILFPWLTIRLSNAAPMITSSSIAHPL